MSRTSGAESGRVRLALAVIVSSVVVLLAPWLVATPEASSLLALAALAAAALVRCHGPVAQRLAAVQAPPRPTDAQGVVLLGGRVTDTSHHPLRPRAPGLV